MNGRRALLYVAGFAGLAAITAVVAGRVAEPFVAPLLLAAAASATLSGAPGLVRRRAWPLALLLLPLGAYLLVRALVPLPPAHERRPELTLPSTPDQLSAGGVAYAHDIFPLDVSSTSRDCACCCRWSSTRVVGRGVPRAEPAPAPPGRRRAPRPRRLRIHDRRVGARSSGPRSPSSCFAGGCSPSRARSGAAPAHHRRARRRGHRRARGAARAVHHRHDGGGGRPAAAATGARGTSQAADRPRSAST